MSAYMRFLEAEVDHRSKDIPIIAQGPWLISALLISLSLLYRYSVRSMSSRDAYQMKPYQIVYYGLFFGVYGVSVPLAYVLTNGGFSMSACDLAAIGI